MSSDLAAHLVYGARLSELDFKEDLLAKYIDEDTGEPDLICLVDDLWKNKIDRVVSYDSEDDNFVGVTLVRTEDWCSTRVDMEIVMEYLTECKGCWLEYITNPEVLRVELIPQYF